MPKTLPTLWLFAFCATASVAQVEAPSLRPSLVGLQVDHLDASVGWYVSILGFQQKDRKEFPELKLKLVILAMHDFELKSQGARFAIELRDSNTDPDKQHFVVLGPDGNWLQFVGKKP